MATMNMGFLPTIKCSNCGNNVEISAMGDHMHHVDSRPLPDSPYCNDSSITTPSAGLDAPDRLTTAMAAKPGRSGAPPRIDPSIANRAFLQPNMPTPASSIGSQMPSPLSIHSALRSPMHLPSPTTQVSPDDESVIDLDTVFSFPMPGNRSPALVGTPGRMGDGPVPPARSPARSPAPTPSPRLGLELVPENIELPPSPLPPQPESTEMGHRRGDSMASHSSYRTSLASTRYGSSTARSSTHSFTRGFRSFMDDTPPVPPAPLRTPNKSSFPRDSNHSVSSAYPSDRGEAYSGFNFGTSPAHNHNATGLHDLPEESSLNQSRVNHNHDYQPYVSSRLHPADAEAGSDAPRKNSDATSESAISITNFARALGLDDHQAHKPEGSMSSESSPSDTRSGSSMSSLPSDTSLNRHKTSDPLNLGPLVEALPPRTRQTILELPGRIRSTMDDVPPIPAVFFSPDSPTDPAIGRGGLSLIAEKREIAPAKQQQPQEPPSPRRPIQRSATAPIPRPATSSGSRSKGNCKGCGEAIMGKSISSSDGRLTGRYHRGCFVCFECHSPFQTADFYVLNNRPYCAQHYHERNGSLCSTCHHGIEGQYLETVEQNGGHPDRRRFHPDCLQCRTCHVSLKGDYFEWNGEVYCEQDARRAANAYYRPPPGPSGSLRPPGPSGPPGRRRPTIGSSPLAQPRGNPPAGYPPPPSPAPSSAGARLGPRYPSGGARRFPERRTTKLMMI
ncbi:uncharacterized protein N7482_008023 [Penicillium canariense]|uniref:LIM zinc-binding domain-containing protein n=1 Tax=Penicillium canariense TaxID=189055 RepID=A0A9W9HSC1_9EURO|nr:uncharacterized protein N7482_008023 [Penicillium canariense]KAJ5156923.1 hypothetical protein N7482_008023 [Penicillium canariense]